MSDNSRNNSRQAQINGSRPRPSSLNVRQVKPAGNWELVHPNCARARAEDMEEVHKMVEAGENDVALDELRWLLNGCADFVDAHRTLGELALIEEDYPLARGHFGYAYEIGLSPILREKRASRFPYSRPANKAFLESAKGLAFCLVQLEKPELAREVLEKLLTFDPSDPLNAAEMLRNLPAAPKA